MSVGIVRSTVGGVFAGASISNPMLPPPRAFWGGSGGESNISFFRTRLCVVLSVYESGIVDAIVFPKAAVPGSNLGGRTEYSSLLHTGAREGCVLEGGVNTGVWRVRVE